MKIKINFVQVQQQTRPARMSTCCPTMFIIILPGFVNLWSHIFFMQGKFLLSGEMRIRTEYLAGGVAKFVNAHPNFCFICLVVKKCVSEASLLL